MQRPDCNNSFTKALIAVGSNGSSEINLSFRIVREAIDRVAAETGGDAVVSRFFRTPAFPAGAGPDFVNAAFTVDWTGSADSLLDLLHGVEAEAGRTRTHRWEARVLDLDLLALGDQVHPDAPTQTNWRNMPLSEAATRAPEQLILPHPRLQERGFVLVPLADVAPDWRHPLTGDTVRAMLDRLPPAELQEIVALDGD